MGNNVNNNAFDSIFDEIKKLQDDPSVPQSVSNKMVLAALMAIHKEFISFRKSLDISIGSLSGKLEESIEMLSKQQKDLEQRVVDVERREESNRKIEEAKRQSVVTMEWIVEKMFQPIVMVVIAAVVSYVVSYLLK